MLYAADTYVVHRYKGYGSVVRIMVSIEHVKSYFQSITNNLLQKEELYGTTKRTDGGKRKLPDSFEGRKGEGAESSSLRQS